MTKCYAHHPAPESLAYISVTEGEMAQTTLEEALSRAMVRPENIPGVQRVIEALYALTNGADAIVLDGEF